MSAQPRFGKEQFAGWGMYDNVAICLAHGHEHLIAKSEQITNQPWYDWLKKHEHCGGEETVFLMPYSLREKLGERLARLSHNADVKVSYAASAAYTITLTGLPTDTNLLTGREGTGLSNASNKYLDELVSALTTTGTTPTVSRVIELHIIGALDDTPTYPAPFDGTDSAETNTSADTKASICTQLGGVIVSATSDVAYYHRPLGIRQFFGDAMPVAHVPFVTHSTAVNLNATAANQFVKHTPVYATVV